MKEIDGERLKRFGDWLAGSGYELTAIEAVLLDTYDSWLDKGLQFQAQEDDYQDEMMENLNLERGG